MARVNAQLSERLGRAKLSSTRNYEKCKVIHIEAQTDAFLKFYSLQSLG